MSRKTRKLMWSVPLIAAVAVIGALAAFMTLTPNGTQAHDLAMPGIVTDVKAEAKGRDTIDVSWKMPASGGTPDYYRIDRSTDGDNWMRLVEMHTGSTSYTDMYKLKANSPYHYRVFAVNSAGTGPSSDLTASSMATTNDSGRPGVVRMLTGKVMGPNQINLAWYPPASDGGADITRYCIVTVAGTADLPPIGLCAHDTAPTDAAGLGTINTTADGGTVVIRAPEGDGKVEFMHKNLPASTARKYEVYAVNSKGVSTAATAVAPVPQTADPGKPSTPTLRVVATTPGDIDLYWTWPADNGGADISSFEWASKTGSGSWGTPTEVKSPTGTSTVDPQVNNADPISATTSYRVRASNDTKTSEWSNVVTIRTNSAGDALVTAAPPAVANLSASTDTSMRQIDLEWDDVSNTSYLIDVRKGANGNWMVLQGNTGYTRSTYNHRGLDPDTDATDDNDYEYRVFSLMNGAYGPPPDGRVKGSTSPATVPASVRGLKTSSDDPTMIMVDWDKPTFDGGQPITGYRIEIGLDDSFPSTGPDKGHSPTHMSEDCPTIPEDKDRTNYVCVREIMGADNTMYTLGKLKAGTDRWFRVFAVNKVVEDTHTFPDAADERGAVGVKGTSARSGNPGIPLGLTAQAARDANIINPAQLGIDILWNTPGNPSGDSVTGYVVARRTKDNSDAAWSDWDYDWASISDEGSDFLRTNVTDTDEPDNYANGEMRQYKVAAKSGAGMGKFTDMVTYPAMTGMHDHVMASGTIMDETVTIGMTETVDASMYFTGAMSYSVMSSMPSYATAMVDENTGMVTITGVAAGMSTITVTATDMFMGTATQSFDVTVEAAEPAEALVVTDSDAAAGTITIEWQAIPGAVLYHAIAYNRTTNELPQGALKVGLPGTDRMTMFTGLTAGPYAIGLIGEMANGEERLVLLPMPHDLR